MISSELNSVLLYEIQACLFWPILTGLQKSSLYYSRDIIGKTDESPSDLCVYSCSLSLSCYHWPRDT